MAQKSSALSRHAAPKGTTDDDTSPGKLVRYSLDPKNPPPLTEEQERELAALAELPDDQIDFSDIPQLTEESLRNSIRNPFLYPPVRLSADVIEWFKMRTKGEGDMMMAINRVLLDHIEAEKKRAKKAG